ncbi:putative anaphase promoting complex subunit 11 [Toxoplasma gondii TgCatPRC2]|uniref:Anaphase-promoting complex subunit 11 n=1 Tax=Toxoplasma gondii TgCatPRC2 TaxID=1130821 RepID=A0A151H6L1_TOXGO|nr:putative anaphase promoting complex subunit 11 [Toxoplasma gondii TgCatPRC2]
MESASPEAADKRQFPAGSANDLLLLRAASLSPHSRVRVRHVHFVGGWRWAGVPPDEKCGICSNAFEVHCSACDRPGEACPPAFGACGHVFHLHCIGTWLSREDALRESQANCPLCRRPWRFKTANEASSSESDMQQSGLLGSPS